MYSKKRRVCQILSSLSWNGLIEYRNEKWSDYWINYSYGAEQFLKQYECIQLIRKNKYWKFSYFRSGALIIEYWYGDLVHLSNGTTSNKMDQRLSNSLYFHVIPSTVGKVIWNKISLWVCGCQGQRSKKHGHEDKNQN